MLGQEGSLVQVLWVDLHLPVPCPQVDLGKVSSLPEAVQAVIDSGDGVLVIPPGSMCQWTGVVSSPSLP